MHPQHQHSTRVARTLSLAMVLLDRWPAFGEERFALSDELPPEPLLLPLKLVGMVQNLFEYQS